MLSFIDRFRTINYQDIITKEITKYKVSYWLIIPLFCVFIFCWAIIIWQLALGTFEAVNYLKQKSYKKEPQSYSVNISPSPVVSSLCKSKAGFFFFIEDSHLKTFTKEKDTADDI